MSVTIQHEDFDLNAEVLALRASSNNVGAIVSFVGLVRDMSPDGQVESIFLEYYPGMCEKELNKIIAEATERWQLIGTRVIHRIGLLHPNEQIVLVAAASSHRGAAFKGCEFIIDYLKTAAPFWKKEIKPDGDVWLETKETDKQRMQHWRSQK